MCATHSSTCGKAAVVALKAAHDNPSSVCSPRLRYLEITVKRFSAWLDSKGKNGKQFVENIMDYGVNANCSSGSSPYYHSDSGRQMPFITGEGWQAIRESNAYDER